MSDGPIRFVQPNLPSAANVYDNYGSRFWPSKVGEDFQAILESGMVSNAEWCRKVEGWATSNLGAKHAVAVSSCTSGLQLAARILGKAGMRSVLPSWTWISTGLAAMESGMKPMFVDIDPATLTAKDMAAGLKMHEGAVRILPNVFGVDADLKREQTDAETRGDPLIIDAAHAIASKYHGQPVGGFGDCAVFSLSPSKFATGGEGGIVTTNDPELADLLRAYRDVGGVDRACHYPGMNAKLSEFNACVAWHSVQGLGAEVKAREVAGSAYDSAFGEALGEGKLSLQHRPAYNRGSGRQYYPIILPSVADRARVEVACADAEIPTRGYYRPALHQQPMFEGVEAPFGLRNTESIGSRVLHLPIHAGISETIANAIADVVLGGLP